MKSLLRKIEPYLYLIPCLLGFCIFMFFPFIKTIFLSFNITNANGEAVEFVGLDNYKELFLSPDFIGSIGVTLKFVVMTAIPAILIGLGLAMLANNKLKGSRVYEVMFAMPMAVSSAAAAIIWMLLYHPSIGLLNYLLKAQIGWLTDEKIALFSVALVTVWLNIGLNFIFILTGLKNIPKEMNESAQIDGAKMGRKFFRLTIPLISPTLFFVVFINMINSFQAFGQIKLLTLGGPANSTNVIVHEIYREAFFNNRFETACAESIVLFFIILIITLIQLKFEKKGVYYS
ncbi:carbohydrate ABC transporter permease [Clostridium saccharoperbutylacetonicum]|uniref:carbohydrate ABC transporter permease n=1 Tax=Clostridium saccharoperbutylacetonicum TaxID=36745 RepID=UPI000983FA42|nr:sugar ABC transporter permease [Clostridium saccharoperbutylacetonicum]AQR96680.1 sn-glycerol-3-phosphate transport system permease protein UgpA [Clostridium saccharoperbutylacetonicum]NSB32556.1 sn-glycerol 3-phosphate transport system permease protein [Clostridium saccharoperbutylacetonicum]